MKGTPYKSPRRKKSERPDALVRCSSQRWNRRAIGVISLGLAGAFILAGCNDPQPPEDESEKIANAEVTIATTGNTRGMVSGLDPASATGLEVSLGDALAVESGLADSSSEVLWVYNQQAEADLELGRLSREDGEDFSWAGPYLRATPSLLVHADATEDNNVAQSVARDETIVHITSAEEFAQARVCVVDGTAASEVLDNLPEADYELAGSYVDCATGFESGRYDAIAGEDVSLLGLISEGEDSQSPLSGENQILRWPAVVDADASEIPESLMQPVEYWVKMPRNTSQCEDLTAGLKELADNGELEELLDEWSSTQDVEMNVTEDDAITESLEATDGESVASGSADADEDSEGTIPALVPVSSADIKSEHC